MNPFQQEYDSMINALEGARQQVEAISNPDVMALKNRIIANLNRDINSLKARDTKISGIATANKRTSPPLMKFLGNNLPPVESRKKKEFENNIPTGLKAFNEKVQQTTEQVQGQELEQTANKLYDEFNEMDYDNLRDKYSDVEILAVARKAELPVTEKTAINKQLVDHIKEAITKQKEIDEKERQLNEKVKNQLKEAQPKKDESSKDK
jgi:hypothetical protein